MAERAGSSRANKAPGVSKFVKALKANTSPSKPPATPHVATQQKRPREKAGSSPEQESKIKPTDDSEEEESEKEYDHCSRG